MDNKELTQFMLNKFANNVNRYQLEYVKNENKGFVFCQYNSWWCGYLALEMNTLSKKVIKDIKSGDINCSFEPSISFTNFDNDKGVVIIGIDTMSYNKQPCLKELDEMLSNLRKQIVEYV